MAVHLLTSIRSLFQTEPKQGININSEQRAKALDEGRPGPNYPRVPTRGNVQSSQSAARARLASFRTPTAANFGARAASAAPISAEQHTFDDTQNISGLPSDQESTAERYSKDFKNYNLYKCSAAHALIQNRGGDFTTVPFERTQGILGEPYANEDAAKEKIKDTFDQLNIDVKHNDAKQDINFISALLIAVTGIHTANDLSDQAKMFANVKNSDLVWVPDSDKSIHEFEARDILQAATNVPQEANFKNITEPPSAETGNDASPEASDSFAKQILKRIGQDYNLNIDLTIVHCRDEARPNCRDFNFFTKASEIHSYDETHNPDESSKQKIVLYYSQGKFHLLTETDHPFNSELTPEKRLAWKTSFGKFLSKSADLRRKKRVEARKMSDKELADAYNDDKKKLSENKLDKEVKKEYGKRTDLRHSKHGLYSASYLLRKKLTFSYTQLTPEVGVTHSGEVSDSDRKAVRFSRLKTEKLEEIENGFRVANKTFTGYEKKDFERAKIVSAMAPASINQGIRRKIETSHQGVAIYSDDFRRNKLPLRPEVPEQIAIVTKRQIGEFHTGFVKAISELNKITERNIHLKEHCDSIKKKLTIAYTAFENAIRNGDKNMLIQSYERCREALDICNCESNGFNPSAADRARVVNESIMMQSAANPVQSKDITAELSEQNFKRCFKLCAVEKSDQEKFISAFKLKEKIKISLRNAQDSCLAFSQDEELKNVLNIVSFQLNNETACLEDVERGFKEKFTSLPKDSHGPIEALQEQFNGGFKKSLVKAQIFKKILFEIEKIEGEFEVADHKDMTVEKLKNAKDAKRGLRNDGVNIFKSFASLQALFTPEAELIVNLDQLDTARKAARVLGQRQDEAVIMAQTMRIRARRTPGNIASPEFAMAAVKARNEAAQARKEDGKIYVEATKAEVEFAKTTLERAIAEESNPNATENADVRAGKTKMAERYLKRMNEVLNDEAVPNLIKASDIARTVENIAAAVTVENAMESELKLTEDDMRRAREAERAKADAAAAASGS